MTLPGEKLPGERGGQPPIAEGEIIAGKYQVEKIIGTGGMGIVVAARHLELEERVAIKFLLPTVAERDDSSHRFRREARAAAKIKGEHVCRVFDVGETDKGISYMVMEYLEGHDLGEELQRFGTLAPEIAIGYALEAIEAVAQAHAAGIVHRDLKPANLYLARRPDGSSVIKVLDFGISKSLIARSMEDISLTASASLMGSPLYMSPEQLQSARDVDARTDIWALGSILYEMLAGRPPYLAETFPQLCAALLNDRPPPLLSLRPDLPPGLCAAVDRCLQKDRAMRWPTISDFASAISEFGEARSRVHAERASRVQGSTDVTISTSGITAPPTERMVGSNHSHRPTVSNWSDSKNAQAAKGRARLWIFAGAAVALLIGGFVIFRLSGSAEGKPNGPAASPSLTREPVPEAKATVEPKVSPTPTPPLNAPSEPRVEPSAVASTTEATPSTSAAAALTQKAVGPSRPRQPKVSPTRPTQPATTPGSSISDFGGRR